MIHAIAYSPRNPSTSLRFIDQADVRVPTIEEIRARKARLYGKSDGYEYRVPKRVVVDFSRDNMDNCYVGKIKCGIVVASPMGPAVVCREVPAFEVVPHMPLRPRLPPRLAVPFDETMSIIVRVAAEHDIPVAHILSPNKGVRAVILARRHAMWALITERPEFTYSAVGRAFGRDHTTVMHNIQCYARDNCLPMIARMKGRPYPSVVR